MISTISHLSIIVKDYNEALDFYINKLEFVIFDDQPMPQFEPSERWIVISPSKDNQTMINFGLATTEDSLLFVENQSGKNPLITLTSTDIKEDLENFKSKGVKVVSEIQSQPWGMDAMIADLYGSSIVQEHSV
jgi:predicted enzyme related to lactoylglutathione lyase